MMDKIPGLMVDPRADKPQQLKIATAALLVLLSDGTPLGSSSHWQKPVAAQHILFTLDPLSLPPLFLQDSWQTTTERLWSTLLLPVAPQG